MRFSVFLAVISSFALDNVGGRTSESLKVRLPDGGKLVGRYLTSISGRGIRAFMGIPYAKPPIGELRFKAPVPFPEWEGERQATKDSAICIQRDPFRRDYEIEGDEDCLYLNVYTPTKPSKARLPVMVFFHGGGWMCGSGVSYFYGPNHLLDHDVVYIGANFRLGPLGFLSTGTKECPGNNGLKDQVEVLRWIQKNVVAFGGDPDQVTVFGESAGGASGTYHMMSPLSQGLFKQVISQSGANFNPWAQPAHKGVAEKRARQLAEMLGCSDKIGNWGDTIECLRKVPAADITAANYDFFEWDTDPMIPFPPVVEADLPGAFITKHPREVPRPHGLSIPWMAGLTADEGAIKSAPLINNSNWDRALQVSLFLTHHDAPAREQITRKIKEFYFGDRKLEAATEQNLTNLYTDAWFLHGMDEYFRLRLSEQNKGDAGPTFIYLFNHKGAASFTEIFHGGREKYYGVSHAEELQYLFPIGKELFVSAVPTDEDERIRRVLVKMWVNFAETGNPTPGPGTEEGENTVKWVEATQYPVNYLRIGNKDVEDRPLVEMEANLLQERADFWMEIGAHEAAGVRRDEL